MPDHIQTEKEKEDQKKAEALAVDVLQLSRSILMANLRFMDSALSSLKLVPIPFSTIATDGEGLYFNPIYVLKSYLEEPSSLSRTLLHMTLHCVFRHMYVNAGIDHDIWGLACDMAVEYTICDMHLKEVETRAEKERREFLCALQKEITYMTAERIFHYYNGQMLTFLQKMALRTRFLADDHDIWYAEESAVNQIPRHGIGKDAGEGDKKASSSGEASLSGDKENDNESSGNQTVRVSRRGSSPLVAEKKWMDISEKMESDLETFSKTAGDKVGALMQNLRELNRETYDYSTFLRKFSCLGEVKKINDEEFDYIFYTYGLQLYGKMPLIEPLEYKDVKRIRDFVIVIDTSGSVKGDLVQAFIQKTWNILKETENYFSKMNLHILQCDAAIQEDLKITTQAEFDEAMKTFTVKGLGGTDFRPAFAYTEELIRDREFTDLKGLIYFTDGYGVFPAERPSFRTAFVFIDEAGSNPKVPPWAMKLVLPKSDLGKEKK